jgi:spermidine/putrescine transport system ATP-binding protein
MFQAKVDQVIYKGSTVDLQLKLPSGRIISATEFFDEADDSLDYKPDETVWIEWIPGWEVVLPYER